MATRTVILSVVFVMSLIMAQTHVDAQINWCCPSFFARAGFKACRLGGFDLITCSQIATCIMVIDMECPGGYTNHDIPENSADAVKEYCNLGCVSSACGALTTLHNSDPSGIVNGVVERCTNACSTFCTKGSMTAVESR